MYIYKIDDTMGLGTEHDTSMLVHKEVIQS
jgi:hypothetical protein